MFLLYLHLPLIITYIYMYLLRQNISKLKLNTVLKRIYKFYRVTQIRISTCIRTVSFFLKITYFSCEYIFVDGFEDTDQPI